LNNSIVLQGNEIGETKGLVSCHVCIAEIKSFKKKYVIMSHYRVADVNEHVSQIRSIIDNLLDVDIESVANVLLFRLSSKKLMERSAAAGTIYHIDKYEYTTKLLKKQLMHVFPNADIREIPYESKERHGDWVRVNVRNETWASSFGSGPIEN